MTKIYCNVYSSTMEGFRWIDIVVNSQHQDHSIETWNELDLNKKLQYISAKYEPFPTCLLIIIHTIATASFNLKSSLKCIRKLERSSRIILKYWWKIIFCHMTHPYMDITFVLVSILSVRELTYNSIDVK